MNLIRWNPAYDLLNVHSELDRVFGELLNGTGMGMRYSNGAQSQAFLPVDVRREGDNVVIEASVPGFKPEEVSVTVDGGVLTIAANRDETQETGEGEFLRRERYSGQFYRQISLGDQVDGEKANAAFEHGVLKVVVPMITKPEPKRIPVSVPTEAQKSK